MIIPQFKELRPGLVSSRPLHFRPLSNSNPTWHLDLFTSHKRAKCQHICQQLRPPCVERVSKTYSKRGTLRTGAPPCDGLFSDCQTSSRPWGSGADELEVRRQEALAACSAFVDESAPLRLLFKLIGGRRAIAQLIVLVPKPGVRLIGGFSKRASSSR